jgi:GAF domain-containing protein
MIAGIPEDEPERLRALRSYYLEENGEHGVLDEIVHLAQHICQCPIATISVIEEFRQRYIAQLGMVLKETPRDFAFCAHTIVEKSMVVVPDTRLDHRFFDNPVVTGPPHVRFYAGVPLINEDGFALGTLCVVDTKPRELSFEQIWALESLRKHIVTHLELRRTSIKLGEALQEIALLRRQLER